MWNLFVPDAYIGDLMMFDQVALSKQRVIACDIDNTLIAHDVDVADERAKRFLAYLQERGFQVILVSNNRALCAERIASLCGVCEKTAALCLPSNQKKDALSDG